MKAIIGVDASTTFTGVGIFVVEERESPRLLDLYGFRMSGGTRGAIEDVPKILRRVLTRLAETPSICREKVLVIEEAPPTARGAHQGMRGQQGKIGFDLGFVAGLIAGGFSWSQVELVSSPDWRASMLAHANTQKHMLTKNPKREKSSEIRSISRSGEELNVLLNCGHSRKLASDAILKHWTPNCNECRRPADLARDYWKETAVQYVRHFWPDGGIERLVLEARRRARETTLDHRLAGVADACEAVAIAHHHIWRKSCTS